MAKRFNLESTMPTSQQLLNIPADAHSISAPSLLLNHEALAILLAHTLKLKKEQTFVLAGPEDLRALLPKLRLQADGDEAFILFRPYVHTMAFYLRVESGGVHAFLFDSQNWGVRYYPNRLAAAYLQQFFPRLRLIFSGDTLQSQDIQEGCSQYSLFFLNYVAVHGADWFSTVAKGSNCVPIEGYPGLESLAPGNLPLALQAIAMEQDPDWYQRYRLQNIAELDGLLTDYADAADDINWPMVFNTVKTMQGIYHPACSILTTPPSLLNIKVLSPTAFCLQAGSAQASVYYRFSNNLLYSAESYPAAVTESGLKSLFDNRSNLTVSRDRNNQAITVQAASAEAMMQELDNLLYLDEDRLWNAQMRQWGGLHALVQEIKAALFLHPVCQDNAGGFYQDQIQMALRCALSVQENIYVPDLAFLAGQTAALSLKSLFEDGFNHVAFAVAANSIHQVAVWVHLDAAGHRVFVYDSLPAPALSLALTERLKNLLCLHEQDQLILQPSLYAPQQDVWSCGAHVFATLLRLAGLKAPFLQEERLDVARVSASIYTCWQQDLATHSNHEAEKSANQQKAIQLLDIIECYRNTKEHYLPSANDALQAVADALQLQVWGNLDRQPLHSGQVGRLMDGSSSQYGLSLLKLRQQQENKIARLVLGLADRCQILSTLNWTALFDWIADNHALLLLKEVNDAIQLLGSEYTPEKNQPLRDCMLESMDASLEKLAALLYGDEASYYVNGMIQHAGEANMPAICLGFFLWLEAQYETTEQRQENTDRRIQAEQKSANLALKNWFEESLRSMEVDEHALQAFLTENRLTSSLRAMMSTVPKEAFRQLDQQYKQHLLQSVVNMPMLPLTTEEEEKAFVLRFFINQPGQQEQPFSSSIDQSNQPSFEMFLQTWLLVLYEKQLLKKRPDNNALQRLREGVAINRLQTWLQSLHEKRLLKNRSFLFDNNVLQRLYDGVAINLFSLSDIDNMSEETCRTILSSSGLAALLSGIITIHDFEQFYPIRFDERDLNNIQWLQNAGLTMPFFRNLSPLILTHLLQDNGVTMVESGELSAQDFTTLPVDLIVMLLNAAVQENIQNKLVTKAAIIKAYTKGCLPDDFVQALKPESIKCLFTSAGLHMLIASKLSTISLDEASSLTPDLIMALQQGYIVPKDLPCKYPASTIAALADGLLTLSDLEKRPLLQNEYIIKMIRAGALTPTLLLTLPDETASALEKSFYGVLALTTGKITLKNLSNPSPVYSRVLLNGTVAENLWRGLVLEQEIILCIQSGCFEPAFPDGWDIAILEAFMKSHVLQALLDGQFSVDDLLSFPNWELKRDPPVILNPITIKALQNSVISIKFLKTVPIELISQCVYHDRMALLGAIERTNIELDPWAWRQLSHPCSNLTRAYQDGELTTYLQSIGLSNAISSRTGHVPVPVIELTASSKQKEGFYKQDRLGIFRNSGSERRQDPEDRPFFGR